jgi:hypothetical protein
MFHCCSVLAYLLLFIAFGFCVKWMCCFAPCNCCIDPCTKGSGFLNNFFCCFKCGEDNEGQGFEQASGLVRLGRGPLSLVPQLKEQKLSYCLISMNDTKVNLELN